MDRIPLSETSMMVGLNRACNAFSKGGGLVVEQPPPLCPRPALI
jgi:hypothetical protein